MKAKLVVLLLSLGGILLLTTCASQRKLHLAKGQDPLTFNHQLSAFPLTETHAKLPCQSCHLDGQYRETPAPCQNCHAGATAHTNDTNSNCELCHSTWNWLAVSFNHNQLRFALREKHAQIDCLDCHKTNSFRGLGRECFGCHEDIHRGTMGAKCQICHSEMLWKPARFDHQLTDFPLTGKHAALDCESCHRDTFATATPKQCVACHQQDAPPDHFGPQCADCHTSSGWKPARFDHAVFPIKAGPHSRATCSQGSPTPKAYGEDCHTVRGFYKEFSCISGDCHPQDKMERKHRNKSGYVYESFACFKCHPTGREEKDGD